MGFMLTIILSPYWVSRSLLLAFITIWDINTRFYRNMLKKKKPTHGDAAFTDLKKLKKLGHFEQKGWLAGVVYVRRWRSFWKLTPQRLYTNPEASGIAMSPKGQGKTQSAIAQLRDLAERDAKDDVVIVDPAGDLHVGTASIFAAAGYRVRVIDFVHPRESDVYDPLSVLHPHSDFDFDREIDQFCNLILPDDAHSREAHFQEFARILLAGTIAYMMITEPANTTLYNAVARLTTDVAKRNAMFSEMRKSGSAIVKQAVSAFDEAGDKEKGSFSTTMARKMHVWLRSAVRALTETGECDDEGKLLRGWSWQDVYLDPQPTVTYIVTGLGTGEGAAARLILGNAINTRRYMWNVTRQKPAKGLRLLVDEAREIGNCAAIMDANNELRKAGVSVMMWFLAAKDVFDTYPQAKTLINNSDLFVFGGSKEMDFMEDVSRLIGEKTIENPGYSESDHGASKSASEQARRVIKADELRRMTYTEMVAVMGNIGVKCEKPFSLSKTGVKFL